MLSIRTQKRAGLVPYNVPIIAVDGVIRWYYTKEGSIKLGTYATQERALQVLDEIEIENNRFYKAMNGGINAHSAIYTYQMPSE